MIAGLEGRKLLVTGAGSGIGLATVSGAIAAGAQVAGTVQDSAQKQALLNAVPGVVAIEADLAAPGGAEDAVAAAAGAFGGLDGLASAAGIFDLRRIEATTRDDWARTMSINLTAGYAAARALLPHAGAGSSIVFVSSQIGLIGHYSGAAYAASKAGLNGLTRALAIELAPKNIRVNAIAPGPIATPMTEVARNDATRHDKLVGGIPLGRFGAPEEVAAAILFFLSGTASFITGQILCVDGGFTTQ